MPQGKQEQYEDALGSIFDFIFAQSQKPPSKTKPLKVTGVDGTSEIVDALAAAIENPAMYVNNETMSAFQDFVDIDLAKIQLDDRGGAIKFNLKNIGQIVRDPGKYVDAQFKRAEAIRKSQRMAATGEAMRGIVAGSWAAKKGLDFETRTALAQVGRGDEFSLDMKTRADKLMQKHFSSGAYSVKKSQLIKKYGPKKGEELFNFYQKAEKAYHTGTEKDRAAIFSGAPGNRNISDLYSFLEAENIREKASFETDPQKKEDYRSASRFIENMSAVGELRKVMDESKKRMKYHQDQIKVLKEQGAPKSVIDQHRKSIRDLRSDYNAAQRYEFASQMGTFEGHWNTAKDLFVDGNLLPNVINGKFFSDRFNQIEWLQPAKPFERTFTTNVGLRGKKRVEGKVKFLDAKKGSNKFQQAYYDAMAPLYYLSPVTLVKSLGNGEVFAYTANVIEKAFKKKMGDVLSKSIAGFDMDKFMGEVLSGNGEAYLATLTDSIAPDLLKKMEKFIGQQERWNKLAYNFSAISRARDDITKRLNEMIEKRLGGEINEVIGKRLLEVGFIQKFGKEAVQTWMEKGGLRALASGVVKAALQAVGFSIAGPVGNAIVSALTWVGTEVIMKMAKPVIKTTANVLIFFIGGCFTLFLVVFGSFFLMVFGKYSHVAPNEIVQCSAYNPLGLLPPNEEPPGGGGILPFTPGNLPPGQRCLFSAGPTLRCTQGPYSFCPEDPNYINHFRPSHLNSPAIDVATGGNFHAPTFCDASLGNCKVVATGQGTCGNGYPAGGYVLFTAEYQGRTYQFYILHVAIGVNPGQTLDSGQAVATITDSESWRMCSSGLHAHLTIQVNGSYMDARAVLNQDFQCNVGSCSSVQCWPR